ncbi:protein of unknown function (plasmid) [Rhodovastum atsumiense]|nr:protein of unknown function [Rhodovastum atsumiense]
MFRMPWSSDLRINPQEAKGGMAKSLSGEAAVPGRQPAETNRRGIDAWPLHLPGLLVGERWRVCHHLRRGSEPFPPAPDSGAALAGAQALVRDVVADMRANGETVPEPLASRTCSGRSVQQRFNPNAQIPNDVPRL